MGLHYTFGANKGSRLMEKKAKREAREGKKKEEDMSLLKNLLINTMVFQNLI